MKTPCSLSVCLLFRCQRKYVKNQQGRRRRRRRKNNQNERELFFLDRLQLANFHAWLTQTHRQFSYIYTKWHSNLVRVCVCACASVLCTVCCEVPARRLRVYANSFDNCNCCRLRFSFSFWEKWNWLHSRLLQSFTEVKANREGRDRNSIAFHICIVITAELHYGIK